MALTKTPVTVLAATAVTPPGVTTKAAPAAASVPVDNPSTRPATLAWRIRNGASAPGTPGMLTIQQSLDNGATWFDIYSVAGTITQDEDISGTIVISTGIKKLRALAYGHTTNAVTFEVQLMAVTD